MTSILKINRSDKLIINHYKGDVIPYDLKNDNADDFLINLFADKSKSCSLQNINS